MTKRTKLRDRVLPDYTRGEEVFNMVSHIVGGGFGVIALATCVIKAFISGDAYAIVGSFIYGFSMIALYTMSSIYHGLRSETAKKVFQIMDHCMIFILIAGTYTPITLTVIRRANTALGWTVFGIVWGASALGITLNAIDLKAFKKLSLALYILLGWCIVFTGNTAISSIPTGGLTFLILGGVSYTVGAVIYAIAGRGPSKHRYMHSVFHLFVVLGSVLHYFAILFYILP